MYSRSPSEPLTVGIKMSRGLCTATFVAAVAAALCLLSACVSIGIPRAGEPVTIEPGEAFVFGRIRMLDATNEDIEYSPFWFDPWDQPFFGPGPRMTLELRRLYPPGGAFKYKAYPAPAIEKQGSFFWVLSAGDYMLLGNPRLLGSERFNQEETATLARFTVPASGGTIYLGTLIISIVYDLGSIVPAWSTGEAEYAIRSCRIADEREQELSQLRARFPVFPEPLVTGLMLAE
jgi:hypothetical protein